MSEGWNIAILGATGAVGEALLETLAERQFRSVKFMRWRVMKAPASTSVLVASRSLSRMRRTLTGRRRSWRFSLPAQRHRLPG